MNPGALLNRFWHFNCRARAIDHLFYEGNGGFRHWVTGGRANVSASVSASVPAAFLASVPSGFFASANHSPTNPHARGFGSPSQRNRLSCHDLDRPERRHQQLVEGAFLALARAASGEFSAPRGDLVVTAPKPVSATPQAAAKFRRLPALCSSSAPPMAAGWLPTVVTGYFGGSDMGGLVSHCVSNLR